MFRDATSTSSYLNARLIALEIILLLDPVLIIYIRFFSLFSIYIVFCILFYILLYLLYLVL